VNDDAVDDLLEAVLPAVATLYLGYLGGVGAAVYLEGRRSVRAAQGSSEWRAMLLDLGGEA